MVSKHFKIYELVPFHIYKKFHNRAWQFIDLNLIKTIDTLKEEFPKGTIIVNNYYWNGDRNWSGFRTPGCEYYSETSQHSLGKAVDCIFNSYDVEEVRQFIIDNSEKFPYVKGIELDVRWLHIDVRNSEKLVTFRR